MMKEELPPLRAPLNDHSSYSQLLFLLSLKDRMMVSLIPRQQWRLLPLHGDTLSRSSLLKGRVPISARHPRWSMTDAATVARHADDDELVHMEMCTRRVLQDDLSAFYKVMGLVRSYPSRLVATVVVMVLHLGAFPASSCSRHDHIFSHPQMTSTTLLSNLLVRFMKCVSNRGSNTYKLKN